MSIHEMAERERHRSDERIVAITAGLKGPEVDRWYWREIADRRIHALTEDGSAFGLLPFEARELKLLRDAVAA